MHAADKKLPIFHGAEGVLEVDIARADGLDLRPGEFNARLKALKHKVFMKSLAVARYLLYAQLLRHVRFTSSRFTVSFYHTAMKNKSLNCKHPPRARILVELYQNLS